MNAYTMQTLVASCVSGDKNNYYIVFQFLEAEFCLTDKITLAVKACLVKLPKPKVYIKCWLLSIGFTIKRQILFE